MTETEELVIKAVPTLLMGDYMENPTQSYKEAYHSIHKAWRSYKRDTEQLRFIEHWDLRNRYLHIQATEEWKYQPRLDAPSSTGQVQDKFGTSTDKVLNQSDTNNHNIQQLVLAIGEQQMSVKEMMEALSLKGRDNFLKVYLNPAIDEQYVRLLYPNSPRHPRQKYFLTVKGIALYNMISQKK